MRIVDTGSFSAKIMLVGKAPSIDDARQGVPFSDSPGKLLKQMLSHADISFHSCYVTNIFDTISPSGSFGYYYEDGKRQSPKPELKEAWFKLQEKVKNIKPNVVIALGPEPLRALTNKRSIYRYRGIVIPEFGTKVIATYHPSAVLRQWGFHPIFELDASKAKRHSLTHGYTEPCVNMTLKPTVTDVLEWFSRIVKRVAYDIETVGKNIRCISFATGSIECPRSICIPFIKFQNQEGYSINKGVLKISSGTSETATSYWNTYDEMIVLDAINKLFTNSLIEKVGQNSIAFDAPLIKQNLKMVINNHYMDTMHAHHELYSELPMSLDFQTSMYTDYPNYWSDKVTENDMSEWRYNSMDSIVTYVCSFSIEKILKESNMHDYYFKHKHLLALSLADAQEEGLDINDERRKELIIEHEAILEDWQCKINTIAGGETNPNSHPQMVQLLYGKMGFPKVYKDKNVTTDEKALRALERKYPDEPILEAIIMFRKTRKLISTYLKAKTDEDGKMRTSWNASGTASGRISSSKTIWKTGMAMQQIPKGVGRGITNIRDIFIAGRTKCSCQE